MEEMTILEKRNNIVELIVKLAPEGTKFEWDNANRRFGRCTYSRNRITGKWHNFKITISYELAKRNSWEVVKGVVLHEIAHANTPGHGHDAIWRRECIRLGGDGERCYSNIYNGGDVVPVPPKYIGECPICHKQFLRNRRTDGWCSACNDKRYHIVWRPNTEGELAI